MANVFKTFLNSDLTTTKTLLHEAIPITGTIASGTYGTLTTANYAPGTHERNIKTYSHGMFVSVYDYPHLSSSANHLFDISSGVSPYISQNAAGDFYGAYTSANEYVDHIRTNGVQVDKKVNMYSQMAQVLVGPDISGSTRLFDRDGNFSTLEDKIIDPIFIAFSRLLVKDEIKKGSFILKLGVNGSDGDAAAKLASFEKPGQKTVTIADTGAANNYRVNSPAGEFGVLVATGDVQTGKAPGNESPPKVGLIYYQAGVVVLDGSRIFNVKDAPTALNAGAGDARDEDGILTATGNAQFRQWSTSATSIVRHGTLQVHGTIEDMAHNFKHRIESISFNNTTELNSSVYFCRANHNEFNYSTNPTYLDGSQIRVKNETTDQPISFITTVGLYSADNELLAVAKTSEPIRKDPTNEVTLRVRLDY